MDFMEILLKRDVNIDNILKAETLQNALMESIKTNRTKLAGHGLDIPTISKLIDKNKTSNSMLNWTRKDIRRTSRQRLADLHAQEKQGKWGASKRYEPDAENPFTISLMIDALHQLKNNVKEDDKKTIQIIIDTIKEDEPVKTTTQVRPMLRREETLHEAIIDLSKGYELRTSQITNLHHDKVFTPGYLLLLADAISYASINSDTEAGKKRLRTEKAPKKIHPDIIDKLMEGDTLNKFNELLESEGLELPNRQGIMSSWKRLSERQRKSIYDVKQSIYGRNYKYRRQSAEKHIRVFNKKIDKLKVKWETLKNQLKNQEGEYSWSNVEQQTDEEYENDSEHNQRERDRTRRFGDNKDIIIRDIRKTHNAIKSYIYAKYILIRMINEKEDDVNYDDNYTNEEELIFRDYEDMIGLIGHEEGEQESEVMREWRNMMEEGE